MVFTEGQYWAQRYRMDKFVTWATKKTGDAEKLHVVKCSKHSCTIFSSIFELCYLILLDLEHGVISINFKLGPFHYHFVGAMGDRWGLKIYCNSIHLLLLDLQD